MKNRKLIREDDNYTVKGEIEFLEYDEDNKGKELHSEPKIGYSIIVDAKNNIFYTWLTTPITEILEDNRFKTKNSIYRIEEL